MNEFQKLFKRNDSFDFIKEFFNLVLRDSVDVHGVILLAFASNDALFCVRI